MIWKHDINSVMEEWYRWYFWISFQQMDGNDSKEMLISNMIDSNCFFSLWEVYWNKRQVADSKCILYGSKAEETRKLAQDTSYQTKFLSWTREVTLFTRDRSFLSRPVLELLIAELRPQFSNSRRYIAIFVP